MTVATALEPAPRGRLIEGDANNDALAFLTSTFDQVGRPSWREFLPLAGDRLWWWRGEDGSVEGALLARTWCTSEGIPGVNLGFICTRHDRRRVGVGSSLVATVLEEEEANGAVFAQVWAREHLIGFYERLGFQRIGTEPYVELCPPSIKELDVVPVAFPLATGAHGGLERIRRQQPGNLARGLEGASWTGINPGFPWGGNLEVLLAETHSTSGWYVVTAPASVGCSIVEYGGEPSLFPAATAVVARRTGQPVRANLTDPVLRRAAEGQVKATVGAPFHRFFRSCALDSAAAPSTSWLERI